MADVALALKRLCMWRSGLASWHLGTGTIATPGFQAMRDLEEFRLAARAELNTIVHLLIDKGVFTQAEFEAQFAQDAAMLDQQFAQDFPSYCTTEHGVNIIPAVAAETNKRRGFRRDHPRHLDLTVEDPREGASVAGRQLGRRGGLARASRLTPEARSAIAKQAADCAGIRAGKSTLPDGSKRKIRLYLPGRYHEAPEPPKLPQQRCVLCGRLWDRFQFGVHPAVCTSAMGSTRRDFGHRLGRFESVFGRNVSGLMVTTAGVWNDAALLAVANRLVLNLSAEKPDPDRVFEGGIMTEPDATFEPGPLTEQFHLLRFINDLIKDMQDLRAGRISVPDARARAELARQVIRSVHLVVTAQRYLEANARQLPAPDAPDMPGPTDPEGGQEVVSMVRQAAGAVLRDQRKAGRRRAHT